MSEQKFAESNLDKVRKAYAAIATNDVDSFVAVFDEPLITVPDCLPYGGRYEGREEAKRGMRNITGAWDNRSYDIEGLLANDTMVVAVGTFIGTGKSTGKAIRFPFHAVWRFREGKLVSLQPVYGDTKLVLEALDGMQPLD